MGQSKKNRFAVIGLGQFGSAIARSLSERGAEVLAIDNDENHIERIADEVAYAVTMEATDKKTLEAQNIHDVDAVVVAIGENFESLLLCCVLLLELKVNRIIARANGERQRMILEKIGVHEILSPETTVGINVAERLLNPSLLSFLQFPDDYEIAEIKAPKSVKDRTLQDIGLRSKYNLNLVTIKRKFETTKNGVIQEEEHILGVPEPKTVISETDTIVVFGTTRDIEKFIEINE